MADDQANVCVFAPSLYLTVTVEALSGDDGYDDLHFHPGGQGFWIARMLSNLGERPLVVAPVGGESGRVLLGLAPAWQVNLSFVEVHQDSPAYLHDRRTGERREIARSRLPSLNRHEADDLYGRVLAIANITGVCVVTGKAPGDFLPLDFYQRLGADLSATGVAVIGDLHGEELAAFLEGGPLHTLKVSDEDLVKDGALTKDATLDERLEAAGRLMARGAGRVVISSSGHRTVARSSDLCLGARPPVLEPADHRGSGDAMTAGLVMGAVRGLDFGQSLRIACAAGAANVTRHGLASADAGLVESLAARVEVEELGTKPR